MTGRPRSTRPGHGARHRGQATVELALGLPVLALAALLVLQVALVGRDAVLVHHAAREAARAAAVEPHDAAARAGALSASGALDPHRLDVDLTRRSGRVRAEVRYQAVTGLPLVGALVPDPVLRASVTMREEE